MPIGSSRRARHFLFLPELERLAKRLEGDQALEKAVKAATRYSRWVVDEPDAHEPDDPETEMLAAVVQAAHADAIAEPMPAGGTFQHVRARLAHFLHLSPLLQHQKFAELDERWAAALAARLKNRDPVDFRKRNRAELGTVRMPDDVTIAIAGDWGTGLPESDLIAAHMQSHQPAFTIHLGDVYYAGSDKEETRFVNRWPKGSSGSFTLNSNHEMYGGGKAYFEVALESEKFAAQGKHSYFSLANDHFVILGLDSAYHSSSAFYSDGALDTAQIEYIQDVLAANPGKYPIVLTHHNGITSKGDLSTAFFETVRTAVGRPFHWIWGHLHAGLVHELRDGVAGRCVGHGGIPYVPFDPATIGKRQLLWAESEYADDPREHSRALNGYYLLELSGQKLKETFLDERRNERWSSETQAIVMSTPFTLTFIGHAPASTSARAIAFEDAVLPLLTDHGAKLLYRGRRAENQDEALPLEVHLIWFPHRAAFDAYLADPRRQALLHEYGEVFSSKQAVVMDTLVADSLDLLHP